MESALAGITIKCLFTDCLRGSQKSYYTTYLKSDGSPLILNGQSPYASATIVGYSCAVAHVISGYGISPSLGVVQTLQEIAKHEQHEVPKGHPAIHTVKEMLLLIHRVIQHQINTKTVVTKKIPLEKKKVEIPVPVVVVKKTPDLSGIITELQTWSQSKDDMILSLHNEIQKRDKIIAHLQQQIQSLVVGQ